MLPVCVSIRAPRAGRKRFLPALRVDCRHVSIRAPRAGRKSIGCQACAQLQRFNPRPACGAKADRKLLLRFDVFVSIRAPRAGRKTKMPAFVDHSACFNPRPACGAKDAVRNAVALPRSFNPRPACGAKVVRCCQRAAVQAVSIRAPRAGRKWLSSRTKRQGLCFKPRPACGAKEQGQMI